MTTRHNHNHSSHGKKQRAGAGLFALANILFSVASIGANAIGSQERTRMDALKAENLHLRNQNEYLRQGANSNRVLEGDLKIELLKLKIEAEKRKLGITDSPFVADGYTEPGNIREEERNASRFNL